MALKALGMHKKAKDDLIQAHNHSTSLNKYHDDIGESMKETNLKMQGLIKKEF